MLALQNGDSGAFDSIVLHYERAVRKFIGRYLRDAARTEDLAQEAFLRVYRARDRYEPTAMFRTWLFTIVTRLCLNEIRSRARQRKVFVVVSSGGDAGGTDEQESFFSTVADNSLETPLESLERDELQEVLQQAIDELPGKQRIAILLLRYEDASYQEIAAALGVSPMAVKSLVNRARENLRSRLASYRQGKWKFRPAPGPREKPGAPTEGAEPATA